MANLWSCVVVPLVVGLQGEAAPRWIAADELVGRLRNGRVGTIDVRGPGEFNGPLGHIAEAWNLPIGELSDRLIEINALRDKPVILVR